MSDTTGRPPKRLPQPSFQGRNGFTEIGDSRLQQDHIAAERHWFAQYVLANRGSYFPSFQDMNDTEYPPSNVSDLRDLIKECQERHSNELEKLFQDQANDYLDEVQNRYISKDGSLSPPNDSKNPEDAFIALDKMYRDNRIQGQTTNWDDAFSRFRYAQLQTILPLQKLLIAAEYKEADARRKRDAQFPQSVEEFKLFRNKDTQLRVAQFLMSDTVKQETMMNKFGWAWRQVQPLTKAYNENAEFKGEIQEMTEDVVAVEVKDPRKKQV